MPKPTIRVEVLAQDAEAEHAAIARFMSSPVPAVKEQVTQGLLTCSARGFVGGVVCHRRRYTAVPCGQGMAGNP
jgi:hypothetical protein